MNQFLSLPVGLLGIAAGVSVLTGGFLDAVVIMGVVAANGVIGYFTESEAEKTIDSLKNLVHPKGQADALGQNSRETGPFGGTLHSADPAAPPR